MIYSELVDVQNRMISLQKSRQNSCNGGGFLPKNSLLPRLYYISGYLMNNEQ